MDGTAADVVDRDSLMQFVQRAKTAVDQAASDAAGTYDFADMTTYDAPRRYRCVPSGGRSFGLGRFPPYRPPQPTLRRV